MGTAKGEAARAGIIAAAWDAVDDTGVEQLLAGVSLRDVAKRAGVSPSTVTYHFESMAALADAMAEALLAQLSMVPVEAVEELLLVEGGNAADSIRAAADLNWAILTLEEEQRYERRLMRLFAATGSPRDGERLRRLFSTGYWGAFLPYLEDVYTRAVELLGLRFIEPFTAESVARIGAALNESMVQQWMIDPGVVRPTLHSDALVALVSAVTVPEAHAGEIAELEVGLAQGVSMGDASPQELSDIEELRSIAALAAPLFVERFDDVTLTDVARTVGISVRDVAARFGTVRRVAAVSFARHVDVLDEAATRRALLDPVLGVVDLLCELARCAQSDRQCALALVAERLSAQLSVGRVRDLDDIRFQVPVGPTLFTMAGPMTDLSPDALYDTVALMVDTALVYAMTRPDVAPAAVAGTVLRLLPRS